MKALVKSFGLYSPPVNWPHPNKHTWLLISPDKKNIPTLPDITNSFRINSELKSYKQRVERLENSLYVKIDMQINKFMRKLKR